MSKALKIREQIKQEIKAGLYGRVHDRFLTTRKLAERKNISLDTAHKILTALKSEGILIADATNPPTISPAAFDQADKISPKRIGLIVTHIASPFFSNLSQSIQKTAADMGYQTLVASTEYDYQREQDIIEDFLSIGLDGLIICPGVDERCLNLYCQLIDRHVPVVLINRRIEGWEHDFVAINNFIGASLIAEHFIKQGYHSFGYLAFSLLKKDQRLSGYRATLMENGLPLPDENIVEDGGGEIQNGYNAMAKLMALPKPPRAVFAFTDLLATGAIQYCHNNNIAVPQQVAIAGFDNLPESLATIPQLTTIEYPIDSIAKVSIQNLLNHINNPTTHVTSKIMLEPHLIPRRSTNPNSPSLE